MGTNYYWYETSTCPHCGRKGEPKHIGKSSAGWVFALHVYPDEGIHDLPDWEEMFSRPGSYIEDEYGSLIDTHTMLGHIQNRKGANDYKKAPWGYENWDRFHASNESEQGPNNLLRSRLSKRCVSHGAGTWDCFVGEFS